ncbi:transcriptional initiation protein Tat [Vibrio metschnikovii]|nr:transcriptional initiation protein Tat [Vibrio metschnikovii]EKO3790662.1 transcriptional initiation protein Tat [Vibrio metschnikovii]EKO3887125.1 transcriptional initiation protein Tat [Vibrio metschnikovii]EKO3935985.1 transcriptional initiation protein Tat [Vibrio metschnikovii]
MKKQSDINQSRRTILKSIAGAAVVGGVVASTSPSALAVETVEEATPQPLQKGYHETPHIRDYYASL